MSVDRLPALERDIWHLTVDLKKSQTMAAKILGMSQPTVNYRLKRARERMKFMAMLPEVQPDEVRFVMHELGAAPEDIDTMLMYVETNCQSEVARRMGRSQGAVRHWLTRAVNRLKKDMRVEEPYRRVKLACQLLVQYPNMLNEVDTKEVASEVYLRLPSAPAWKQQQDGSTVMVESGLLAGLSGTVQSDHELVITLRAKTIYVQW